MGIKIPSNQIKFNYTAGKEYIFKDTYNEYQGYYYELNNKIFAGKEFDAYASELIKIPIDNRGNNLFNPLLTSAATYLYGKISKTQINNSKPTPFYFIPTKQDNQRGYAYRYFSQQKNNSLIKEVSESNFKVLSSNTLYVLVRIKCYVVDDALDPIGNNNFIFDTKELEDAEKIIPGIKTFLLA